MKRKMILAVASVVSFLSGWSTSVIAQSSDEQWVGGGDASGYIARVTYGPGNEIRVSCNHQRDPFGSTFITFQLGGQVPLGNRVILTFDNQNPETVWIDEGRINTMSRAGIGNYEWIVGMLRRYSSVHVLYPDSGTSARFTLRGSSSAILPMERCLTDLFRD